MPPRLPYKSSNLPRIWQEPYVCSSCLLSAAIGPPSLRTPTSKRLNTHVTPNILRRRDDSAAWCSNRRDSGRNIQRRYASNGSLASTTAINAQASVPPAHRDLYHRISALQETASSYVDLSRLQLAMRSLESDDPIIRVALLGLGSHGALAARKLARVLLSDALAEKEKWEQEILDTAADGKSLLLRYGDDGQPSQSIPLVRTMHIPSPFLKRYNLEVLVTTLNAGPAAEQMTDSAALQEAVLVPPLTTPNSADGRVGFVRYPVHKAVVVVEGVSGAIEYGRFPAELTHGGLVNVALVLPLRDAEPTPGDDGATKAVDVALAEEALEVFRASNANGANFSDKWQKSRISGLSEWITEHGYQDDGSSLGPSIQKLIFSMLDNASTTISVSEDAAKALVLASTVPEGKRTTLVSAISQWSADAHRDLQTNLDTAFHSSPSWRRTAWWRLFWRIDDVTASASELLRNRWLTEAEQNLAFLSGRIFDSGLATSDQLSGPSPFLLDEQARAKLAQYESPRTATDTTMAELTQMPSLLARMRDQNGIHALNHPPWPQSINLSRQYMLHTLVPELHRSAQSLLVTTLGTIGGSTALGAWFLAATAGHGLYESGAIVALGLVWGLRRLQRLWGQKREDFAASVREEARRVLGEVETTLTGVVREGGRARVRMEDEEAWREARNAVHECRVAMDKLRKAP